MISHKLVAGFLLIVLAACASPTMQGPASDTPAYARGDVINAHLHSAPLGADEEAYRAKVLAEMDENAIGVSVLHLNEMSDVAVWIDHAPSRFLAGPSFPCWRDVSARPVKCDWDGEVFPDLEWLRSQYEAGRFAVMGEMFFVYAGISPTDPRMAPYWDLAAEFDIPVAIHINRGPPAGSRSRPDGCCPAFDEDLGNPELLRPVLERHPELRIWLQHAGFPAMPELGNIDYDDETFALLADYPNVYVDMTALNAVMPEPLHAAALQAFIDRGFTDRIMVGTDNWSARAVIERYERFDFLSEEQKRAILHDNAARFFRVY